MSERRVELWCDDIQRGCYTLWIDGRIARERHVTGCPVRQAAQEAPESWFRPNTMAHTAGALQGHSERPRPRVTSKVGTEPRGPKETPFSFGPPSKYIPGTNIPKRTNWEPPDWWPTDIVYQTTRQGYHLVPWTPEAMDPEVLARAWEAGQYTRALGDVLMDRTLQHTNQRLHHK